MIYFYYGDNDFEIKQQILLVKKQFSNKYGAENIIVINSSDTSQILAELINTELFSSNRLIIIENIFSNDDLVKKLPDIFSLIPENTEVIITDSNPDKRTKLHKVLSSKNNKEFKIPTNLYQFVKNEAKKQKVEIDKEAIDELVLYTTGNIWRISNEISKLATFKKSISKSDVTKIVEPDAEINVFKLLDSIFSKQIKQVKDQFNHLKQKEDPNRFLALLSSQVFALSIAKNSSKPSSITAKEAHIHPFVMSKMSNTARKVSKNEIARIAKIIAKTDAKLKLSNKEDGWSLIDLAIMRL